MEDARIIPQPVGLKPGQYIAAQRFSGSGNSLVLEIEKIYTDDGKHLLVYARRHTFGRRGGWTVKDASVYSLDAISVVQLTREMVEQRGRAANVKFHNYRASEIRKAQERGTL